MPFAAQQGISGLGSGKPHGLALPPFSVISEPIPMPTCPRCHQTVDAQAIACPYCRTALKAHGHPGIPLYRSVGEESLCATCTYDEDDTCNYPQRPHAKECTLYQNRFQPVATHKSSVKPIDSWLRRNSTWLVLAGIVVVSLVLALRMN